MREKTAEFQRLEQISNDTYELFFKPPADFSFVPGQYISIILPRLEFKNPRDAFRDFSLASSCLDTSTASVIFRDSSSLFKSEIKNMQTGNKLLLEGPSGNFILGPETNICWIAGGIGITPFLSMVRSGQHQDRNVQLLYINSKQVEAIGAKELEDSGISVIHKIGRDSIGTITVPDSIEDIMIAGPPDMVAFTRESLLQQGHPESIIQTEEFAGYDII